MSTAFIRNSVWRRSYDVDDDRAQVSQIHWEPTARNENMFRFRDVLRDTVVSYSDHIRKPGKSLPISMNAMQVLKALFSVMDGQTGRCDPSLDTIAKRSKLSRRTVVRQLDVLRREKIIDWVRRTVKTDNESGGGPKRQQTSNSYFVDLASLPIEILRTLRQRLGNKLKETKKMRAGSGPVPSRAAGQAAKLLANIARNLRAPGNSHHRTLAAASHEERLAYMYQGDADSLREHEEMLRLSSASSASANLALYPSPRT
ncbi:helix-turn-helix domain-containing protein [Novosphingobium beihaiensis]|uniref:Helix-turn-helix domain-containing protein n=1 Tax=Novosphingobium beihaiensis TaxID=2930389 RepID=A0ABT0BRL6_9SPHN|nr:helix-turn-helix domain-containing protein [Novosphingobium beihaiensis]MCJ2187702.1 helix-turn-helix domain-containing protein [Novosphingobium beihaiensis]